MSTPTVTSPQLKRKRYSEEFKINAVKLLEEGNKGRNGGSPVAAAFECARLQRELDHMTRQRDILKKAWGIFSQPPPPARRDPGRADPG